MACVRFGRSEKYGTTECKIGLAPHVYVGAFGAYPVDALHRASSIAKELDDIIKKNPELAAVIPPQVTIALRAVNAASDLLKKGGTIDDIAKAIGPNTASAITSMLRSFL